MRLFLLVCLLLQACGSSFASSAPVQDAQAIVKVALSKVKASTPAPKAQYVKLASDAVMVEIKEFDMMTAKGLIPKLEELDKEGHTELVIKINSYGGSIHWGMEMIQAIEALKTPVTCVVDWKAYSMGAYLLESPACDKRLMTKRSTLLFHEPLVPETGGNAHELRKTADQLEALGESMIASTCERMEMSEDEFRGRIKDRNWTLPYQHALHFKAVDGLIRPQDLPKLTTFEKPSLLQLLLGG